MKTFDPAKFVVTFGGIKVNEGIADGTWIGVKRNKSAFSKKVGVDGKVTRSRQHDRSKIVTLTLMQTSEINDRLSAILNADRAAVNGKGVAAFSIADLSGTTRLESPKAYIIDDPDMELGETATTREWAFDLTEVTDPIHGSNPDD